MSDSLSLSSARLSPTYSLEFGGMDNFVDSRDLEGDSSMPSLESDTMPMASSSSSLVEDFESLISKSVAALESSESVSSPYRVAPSFITQFNPTLSLLPAETHVFIQQQSQVAIKDEIFALKNEIVALNNWVNTLRSEVETELAVIKDRINKILAAYMEDIVNKEKEISDLMQWQQKAIGIEHQNKLAFYTYRNSVTSDLEKLNKENMELRESAAQVAEESKKYQELAAQLAEQLKEKNKSSKEA